MPLTDRETKSHTICEQGLQNSVNSNITNFQET